MLRNMRLSNCENSVTNHVSKFELISVVLNKKVEINVFGSESITIIITILTTQNIIIKLTARL